MSRRDLALSRRTLLGVTALGVVAGCTTRPRHAAPDPDATVVGAARQAELDLLATYDAAHPAHAAHLAHLRALGGPVPSPPPAAAPAAPVPAAAAANAERASVRALQAAAQDATRGGTAALLASIAASHTVLGREGA